MDLIKTHVFKMALDEIGSYEEPPDTAFTIVDLQDIIDKHNNWIKKIPRVRPFYAMKCNNTRIILEILAGLGAGFDCASKVSVLLLSVLLSL